MRRDVNKWTRLARDRLGVGTLMQATDGRAARSDRYRDIFAPLGLQRTPRGPASSRSCWGQLCLHRETSRATFSVEEVPVHRATGAALGRGCPDGVAPWVRTEIGEPEGPGWSMLAADRSVVGLNRGASVAGGTRRTRRRIGPAGRDPRRPPNSRIWIRLIRRCHGYRHGCAAVGRGRARTPPDAVHGDQSIAVIIESGRGSDRPIIMAASGSPIGNRMISGLVCQGLSTRHIADRLHLGADTVQDHLNRCSARQVYTAAASSSPRSCAATTLPARLQVTRSAPLGCLLQRPRPASGDRAAGTCRSTIPRSRRCADDARASAAGCHR